MANEVAGPVYLVVEGDVIVGAFAECEDLSDWIGAQYQDMAADMPHREVLLFERAKFEEWLAQGMALAHVHEQLDLLRTRAASGVISTRAKPSKKGKRGDIRLKQGHAHLGNQHFLLEAMQSWWGKVLPSAYGVFIRLEGQKEQDLFILLRRGRLAAFHEPDLTSMGRDRRKIPADVVKYLSEKHLVPVQGIVVPTAEWTEWSSCSSPWRKVAASLKTNQSRLVPFRWSLVSLMASRAFLGV